MKITIPNFNFKKFHVHVIVFALQIKRQDTVSEDIDEEIENYNYENPNDKENYCPKGDEVCRVIFLG